ncbi:hypothetical protein ACOQFL_03250 [Actinopolyspora sp. H202]
MTGNEIGVYLYVGAAELVDRIGRNAIDTGTTDETAARSEDPGTGVEIVIPQAKIHCCLFHISLAFAWFWRRFRFESLSAPVLTVRAEHC